MLSPRTVLFLPPTNIQHCTSVIPVHHPNRLLRRAFPYRRSVLGISYLLTVLSLPPRQDSTRLEKPRARPEFSVQQRQDSFLLSPRASQQSLSSLFTPLTSPTSGTNRLQPLRQRTSQRCQLHPAAVTAAHRTAPVILSSLTSHFSNPASPIATAHDALPRPRVDFPPRRLRRRAEHHQLRSQLGGSDDKEYAPRPPYPPCAD